MVVLAACNSDEKNREVKQIPLLNLWMEHLDMILIFSGNIIKILWCLVTAPVRKS